MLSFSFNDTIFKSIIASSVLNQILYDGLFLYGNLGDGCAKYEAALEAMREKVVKQIEVVRTTPIWSEIWMKPIR